MTIGTFFEFIQDNHTLHLNSTLNPMPEEQAIGTPTTTNTQSTSTTSMTYLKMLPLILSVKMHTINMEAN
jgi:hypothetical protein